MAPQLAAELGRHPEVRHIKIEDARGKPLGRSFRVKLWPNLVFMRDGRVLRQFARPDAAEVREGMQVLSSGTTEG